MIQSSDECVCPPVSVNYPMPGQNETQLNHKLNTSQVRALLLTCYTCSTKDRIIQDAWCDYHIYDLEFMRERIGDNSILSSVWCPVSDVWCLLCLMSGFLCLVCPAERAVGGSGRLEPSWQLSRKATTPVGNHWAGAGNLDRTNSLTAGHHFRLIKDPHWKL